MSVSENMDAIEGLKESKIDVDVDYNIEDKDIEEIKNEYLDIKARAIQELATSKASELFKNLPDNLSEFYKQIMGEYKDLPVFSRYDMDNLYGKLLLTPNYDLYNIINLMQLRYKENKELLEADSKNLRKLIEIIKKNRTNKEKTIKFALLDNLAFNIEKIIK